MRAVIHTLLQTTVVQTHVLTGSTTPIKSLIGTGSILLLMRLNMPFIITVLLWQRWRFIQISFIMVQVFIQNHGVILRVTILLWLLDMMIRSNISLLKTAGALTGENQVFSGLNTAK